MKGNRIPHPWRDFGRRPIAGAWSPEDHQRLVELAGTMHPAQIGKELGRTEAAIRSRCKLKDISLATTHPNKRWSHEEVKYLRENHKRLTIRQMAKHLGRSYYSTNQKCGALGLDCRLYGDKNHMTIYSSDDVELCRQLHDEGLSRREIADKMDIPYQRVCDFVDYAYRNHG